VVDGDYRLTSVGWHHRLSADGSDKALDPDQRSVAVHRLLPPNGGRLPDRGLCHACCRARWWHGSSAVNRFRRHPGCDGDGRVLPAALTIYPVAALSCCSGRHRTAVAFITAWNLLGWPR
jgi:hypothetical protein